MKPHKRSSAAFAGLTIGLLGGSFNPAHDGHWAMSLYALKHMALDKVWWLVSPQNPLKSKADMAALELRERSARAVARHPRLTVTTIESTLGTQYTADTLRELQRRFPRTRFVWLMGADNLKQIPNWRDWQEIFRRVPVAVFRRPGYPAGRGLGKAAIRFAAAGAPATQGKILARKPRNLLPAWLILDNKLNYSSATKIRKDNPSWQKQHQKPQPKPKRP